MKHLSNYINIRKKPSTTKVTDDNIRKIVKDALDKLGHDADLNHIDVSEVTNMDNLFSCYESDLGENYKDLNPNISKWDVSNVISMSDIFYGCEKFNQDLSQWDVSKVENMCDLFYKCKIFNQELLKWDVSNVINMECMFYGCENFNQDISGWNIQNVKYYDYVFNDCPIKEEFKPHFVK